MGIGDIWNELRYFWIDLTNYTDAEKNVDKYQKLVDKLNEKISKCQAEFDEATAHGTQICQSYAKNPSSAEGEMSRYYAEREDVWNERNEGVLTKMETALSTARDRLSAAQNNLTYWQGCVSAEETALRNELWAKKEEKKNGD